MPFPGSGRRLARLTLVNAALLLAGVLILELAFGDWLGSGPLDRLRVPRGVSWQLDVSALHDASPPVIRYTRDAWGLRGDFGDPSRVNLLTVGGSTTDQRAIGDGDTWQDVLQRRGRAAGLDLRVANAGLDGHSTVGHLASFQRWLRAIPGLRPRFVLFYVGINDYYVEAQARYDDTVRVEVPLLEVMRRKSALWFVHDTLRGARETRQRLRLTNHRVDFAAEALTREPLRADYSFLAPRLDAYEARLRRLAHETRQWSARAIFVTQPTFRHRRTPEGVAGIAAEHDYGGLRLNGMDARNVMRAFDERMRTVAAAEGAVFVDLAWQHDWEAGDFYDHFHMTPAGARRVGERLFEALETVLSGLPRPNPAAS